MFQINVEFRDAVIIFVSALFLAVMTMYFREYKIHKLESQIESTQIILDQITLSQPVGDAFMKCGYNVNYIQQAPAPVPAE